MNYPIGFIGSVAYYFQSYLKQYCQIFLGSDKPQL